MNPLINPMNKTIIIAEAGVNHNGDIDNAIKLIRLAANSGADLIKFQTFDPSSVVTKYAKKANYQIKNTGKQETQIQMIKKLYLSRDNHEVLIQECKKEKIEFFSTPFDIKSLNMLVSLGLKRFKIPSGEITNLPLIRKMGSLKSKIIMSTGMCTMEEIVQAINVLEVAGTSKENIIILHCTSDYPTPFYDVNLKAMISIKEKLGVGIGYSDHTLGIEVSVAAVALGAMVIEKHFTLDRTMEGPDHKASLEPDELKTMVKSIRNIEKAMGGSKKEPTIQELENRLIVRKSIVASKDIKKGELFSSDNLTTKRPGTGISPMLWDEVIGKKAKNNYKYDDIIIL